MDSYWNYINRCKEHNVEPMSLEDWEDEKEAIEIDEAIQND